MREPALLLQVILGTCAIVAHGASENSDGRLTGKGGQFLFGVGTRDDPYNKPKHTGVFSNTKRYAKQLESTSSNVQRRNLKIEHQSKLRGRRLQDVVMETLSNCYMYEDDANAFGDVTSLHPCFNEHCRNKKSSEVCLENVFDYCCDTSLAECSPDENMMQLRNIAPCSPDSCSFFMRDEYSGDRNDDLSFCPFSDQSVCDVKCEANKWQIQEAYKYNSCTYDSNCLKNFVRSYTPAAQRLANRGVNRSSRPLKSNRGHRTSPASRDIPAGFGRTLQEENAGCKAENLAIFFEKMQSEVLPCLTGTKNATGFDLADLEGCDLTFQCQNEIISLPDNLEEYESDGIYHCFRDIATTGGSLVSDLWDVKNGPIPENWQISAAEGLFFKIDECLTSDDEEDTGGPCSPEGLERLFYNFLGNTTVRDCTGELVDGQTNCPDLTKCMDKVLWAIELHIIPNFDENPIANCLAALGSTEVSDEEVKEYFAIFWAENEMSSPQPEWEEVLYVRKLYQWLSACLDSSGEDQGSSNEEVFYPDGWDVNAECQKNREGTSTTCGLGCCAYHDRALAGDLNDFGTQGQATHICGQILLAENSSNAAMSCLRQECGGCYPANGGIWGQLTFKETQALRSPYTSECVSGIYEHCQANPDEAACKEKCPFNCDTRDDDCPCQKSGCSVFYESDFNEQLQCKDFHEQVLKDYVLQGFLYPENEWIRSEMERIGILPDQPPSQAFQLSNSTTEKGNAKGCGKMNEIVECVASTIEFCNTANNFYSSGCQSLSRCGDGVITWGESCDDGNGKPLNDGCKSCRSVDDNWYCPDQGIPCQFCQRDSSEQYKKRRSARSGKDEPAGCAFCTNTRIEGLVAPCFAEECRSVVDYESALACDQKVESFCNALAAESLRDPGCDTYESKAKAFTVPQIPSCKYSVKEFELYSSHIKAIKYAVIECDLIDPTGQDLDTTPMVPYWSPMYSFSDTEFLEIEASNRTLLERLTQFEEGKLIPITNLTDFETNPYAYSSLHKEKSPFAEWNHFYNQKVATMTLTELLDENQFDYDASPEYCDHLPYFETRMTMLPPCIDPVSSLARHVLQRLKFEGVVRESHEFKDFANLDLDNLNGCKSKPGSVQFALELSRTRKDFLNGREVAVESKHRSCYFFNKNNDGQNPDDFEQCDSFEKLLQHNGIRILFGNKLKAPNCLTEDCTEYINACKVSKLLPRAPKVQVDEFKEKADELEQLILQISSSKSWGNTRRILVQISALAASQPISDALQIFRQVTESGEITKVLRGVKDFCPHEYWVYQNETWIINPSWESDPCCNWELRMYQCCPVQDVEGARVRTITGFTDGVLQCSNPDEIKQTFKNLFTTIEQAQKVVEEFQKLADPSQYDKLWEFNDECRELIENKGETVRSQGDCYCQFSTFIPGESRCETSPESMPLCLGECFRRRFEPGGDKENPKLLELIRDEWNLPPASSKEEQNTLFLDAWKMETTEMGCEGPESWHQDIGYSGWEWSCNATCKSENRCYYHQLLEEYAAIWMQENPTSEVEWWMIQYDRENCEAIGGQSICYDWSDDCSQFKCEIPELREIFGTASCEEAENCSKECYDECFSQDACVDSGGTWMENMNECCPSYGYHIVEDGNEFCSLVAPDRPSSWEIQDELCCSAEGGDWRSNQWGGECCLGEWRSYRDGKKTYFYCNDRVDMWRNCHECDVQNCEPLRQECNTCAENLEGCCGEEYRSQNETACLQYKACNDQRDVHNQGTCDDPTPFCSSVWGWPESRHAKCYIPSASSESDCINLGFEWQVQEGRCAKPVSFNATLDECVNTAACKPHEFSILYPGWEAPANGWYREQYCDQGCYLEFDNSNIGSINFETWGGSCTVVQEGGDIWGSIDKSNATCTIRPGQLGTDKEAKCTELGGIYLSSSFYYMSPKMMNQEQCEVGQCDGTLDHRMHPQTYNWLGAQPWSEEQCKRLSESKCDRWCPYCNTKLGAGGGACFADDTEEPAGDDFSQARCESETGYTWYTCPSPSTGAHFENLDGFCGQDDSIPAGIVSHLGCYGNYERCQTEDECFAQGDCHGEYGWLDLQTRICIDTAWTYGDRWWAEDSSTNEWVECTWANRVEVDGICIASRDPVKGCGAGEWWRWHIFGCRTDGLHDRSACEAEGNTWYDRITDESSCHAIKGCKLNRWDVRQLEIEECESCGGVLVNFAKWHGGTWSGSFTRPMVWHAEGQQITSVNSWVGRMSEWKTRTALAKPIMRNYAFYKEIELLAQYNAYRSVLETIACDCGGMGGENCFESTLDGDLMSRNIISDGETTDTGNGVTVVGLSLEDGTSRRRRILQDEGEGANQKTTVAVTTISVGSFPKFEPCQGDDDVSLDTLAVFSTQVENLVVGQIIGDGKGLNVSGEVDTVLVCMDARFDINVRQGLFNTIGLGIKDQSGRIVPVENATYIEQTMSRVCVEVVESGSYFPIYRVSDNMISSTATCSTDCGEGVCVLNQNTSQTECLCKCGFSGDACDSGCTNYCNNQGNCDVGTNKCTCTMGATAPLYTGASCSRLNCPIDDNNQICSSNGNCIIIENDAKCQCEEGFEGEDCGIQILQTTSSDDIGYGSMNPPNDDSSPQFSLPQTNPPTNPSTETESPTTTSITSGTYHILHFSTAVTVMIILIT